MKFYSATFRNGRKITFDAIDADTAIDYGNYRAKTSNTTMIAIGEISKAKAKKIGLDSDESK